MPNIDCHAHVFSADAKAVEGARYRPAYAATLEAWQAQWRRHGVTHGVLVQPSFFGTDNAEMLEAIARDRTHLRGVAVVDPSFDAAALHALAQAGAVALRFNLHGVEAIERCFEGDWRALLERCAVLGWHLEIFVNAGVAPRVVRCLEAIEIAVVFDHFAAPDARAPEATYEALARLAASRPVYCKLSAPYRVDADVPACARHAIAALGPEHVVWGSDWPFTRHEPHATYDVMPHSISQWCGFRGPRVLWDNAARLYRFA